MSQSPPLGCSKDDPPQPAEGDKDSAGQSCKLCKGLVEDCVVGPLLELQAAVAENSCDTCALLLDLSRGFPVEEDSSVSIFPRDEATRTLEVWYLADLDQDDVMLHVFVAPGVKSPLPTIRTLDPVATHSSSDESFALARRWLDDCVNNHENCRTDTDPPLPTRAIDIGLDGKVPVLVETKGATGRYATLSYCWGKTGRKEQLKTTEETLHAHTTEIPVDKLPQTARDAIEICRRLEIPYLWIDALCIIQGDEADWLRESSRMYETYSNSTLTIAAAGSRRCTKGVFREQLYGLPGRQMSTTFRGTQVYARKVPLDDHVGNPLAINTSQQYAGRTAEKSWMLRPLELPLARRAWAVQERVLSRRVLYYTTHEMWWDCDTCWLCACSYGSCSKDEEDERDYDAVEDANYGSFSWLRDAGRNGEITLERVHKKWANIVTLFSGGELSFQSDKLPALSGLAKRFRISLEERFGVEDEYLAGMWRGDLEQQLLWLIGSYGGPSRKGSHPRDRGVPSWSWASVNGVISHAWEEQEDGLEPGFTIKSASVDLSTPDPMGRTSGGHLVVLGMVTHGHDLKKIPSATNIMASLTINPTDSVVMFYPDRPGELDPEESYSCLAATTDESGGSQWFMALKKVDDVFERVGLGVICPMLGIGENMWDNAEDEIITII